MPLNLPTTQTARPDEQSDFVVVANRLPVDLEERPDGSTAWRRSPGGLVHRAGAGSAQQERLLGGLARRRRP